MVQEMPPARVLASNTLGRMEDLRQNSRAAETVFLIKWIKKLDWVNQWPAIGN